MQPGVHAGGVCAFDPNRGLRSGRWHLWRISSLTSFSDLEIQICLVNDPYLFSKGFCSASCGRCTTPAPTSAPTKAPIKAPSPSAGETLPSSTHVYFVYSSS